MKYVHIIVNTAYTAPYIDLVTRNWDSRDHVFYVVRGWSEDKVKIPVQENVFPINNRKNIGNGLRLIKDLNASKKIFHHGLFGTHILLILIMQPWLLKRSNWVVWGGDLYQHLNPKPTLKSKIEEYFKQICIRKFSELSTIVRGDYELARKWYGAKGRFRRAMYSIPMTTAGIDQIISTAPEAMDKDTVHILVGHSATPENNHFEMIDALRKYNNENVKLYALLSYGESEYAEKVIAYGKEAFKDNFIGVTSYMDFKDFVLFINKLDIIVFNHRIQQAFGNFILASYLGKKVYLNAQSTLWDIFKHDHNMIIANTEEIKDLSFASFKEWDKKEAEQNAIIVRSILEEKYIVDMWDALFDK